MAEGMVQGQGIKHANAAVGAAPLISVVIPTFNRARYLREAIESSLQQSLQDVEIVVVDDASTDGTRDVVQAYAATRRVRYLHHQEQRERGAARNIGIRQARGRYIAFLDSDDLWLPRHLESCLWTMRQHPDAGVVFSRSSFVDDAGRLIGHSRTRVFQGQVLTAIVSTLSSGGCNASSCFVKRMLFEQVGYFNEDRALAGSGEDWEMWARLASAARFYATREYTVRIRIHGGQTSADAERMAGSMTKAVEALYQHEALAPRIQHLRPRAFSSLYALIAINYYAAGEMAMARSYLNEALSAYPPCLFVNPYVAYTFLRSLLGKRLTHSLRQAKWALQRQWNH